MSRTVFKPGVCRQKKISLKMGAPKWGQTFFGIEFWHNQKLPKMSKKITKMVNYGPILVGMNQTVPKFWPLWYFEGGDE